MLELPSYLGVTIRYSNNQNYRVEISGQRKVGEITYYSAIISEKIRSYWQPVLSGVNLTDKEINDYFMRDA
jgi:hypothetical protein